MTDKTKKRRKLSHEILAMVALCFFLAFVLYFIVTFLGRSIIDGYCFDHDIYLDELELYNLEQNLIRVGFAVSAIFFVILFFAMFGERLAYVRKITDGVRALQNGEYGKTVELMGDNELTGLAEAVNYLSEGEQRIKEKERRLNEEKEELIRTLSHDIRTPLTSILSYTELLSSKDPLSKEEQKAYFTLVSSKAAQIKELTDILLDGGRRELEHFEDAKLLFAQLADEFDSELDEAYTTVINLTDLTSFAGQFDVGEMRRIFDNLISNVKKYAEPTENVELSISNQDNVVVIKQRNAVKKEAQTAESYKTGINSIRRIAQCYGGTLEINQDDTYFEIRITLSKF